jgi:hypothetical protein
MNIYNERLEMKKLREEFVDYLVEKQGGTVAGTYDLAENAPDEIKKKFERWLELREVVRKKRQEEE